MGFGPSIAQLFNWVNGISDHDSLSDEPMDPAPNDCDLAEWDWVSYDELEFYTIKTALFPCGNSLTRPLPHGVSYVHWKLLDKMDKTADRLDRLLCNGAKDGTDERARMAELRKQDIKRMVRLQCVKIQRRQDKMAFKWIKNDTT